MVIPPFCMVCNCCQLGCWWRRQRWNQWRHILWCILECIFQCIAAAHSVAHLPLQDFLLKTHHLIAPAQWERKRGQLEEQLVELVESEGPHTGDFSLFYTPNIQSLCIYKTSSKIIVCCKKNMRTNSLVVSEPQQPQAWCL
jgi:hypothetical protein